VQKLRTSSNAKRSLPTHLGRWLLSLALASAAGCSLLVDTSGLSGGVSVAASDASVMAAVDASSAWVDAVAEGGASDAPPTCTTLGPASPATVTGWSKPEGARLGQDGVFAMGDETDGLLVATGFGFVVPRTARVVGVTAAIVRSADALGISDREVTLVGASRSSASRAATGAAWPTGMGVATYGGPEDSWGLTLSVDEVQRPTFGVALGVEGTAPTARVDAITVALTYCE